MDPSFAPASPRSTRSSFYSLIECGSSLFVPAPASRRDLSPTPSMFNLPYISSKPASADPGVCAMCGSHLAAANPPGGAGMYPPAPLPGMHTNSTSKLHSVHRRASRSNSERPSLSGPSPLAQSMVAAHSSDGDGIKMSSDMNPSSLVSVAETDSDAASDLAPPNSSTSSLIGVRERLQSWWSRRAETVPAPIP
ncbi:hypothetical protein HK105_200052 [Polyrhizophydium stewartii]|uniref:Uncharacterized protein n=1 Tax=Polyrhizophydium stewartii TaxID=2732419 RepID=A0ABR4NKD1_9FUNG|nr:hypothetical protein HK105_007227 [Polyrhizophydium stewartii]